MKRYQFLIRFLLKLVLLALLFWILLTFVIRPYRMDGNSMFPAVRDGDLGIFYQIGDAYVDDVVLYRADGALHVGRIVAYGGQAVDFPENGGYTVNGYIPSEEVPYPTFAGDGQAYPLDVPEGSFFILNDFRSDLTDSRTYGILSENDVCGKLLFLLRRRNF